MAELNYKRIIDIADILNGYAFKSKEYVSSGIRIIRIANVQDGYICDETPCFYPEQTQPLIEKYLLKDGDILISLTGNVGRIGIINNDYLPAALNQRVACIRLKSNDVNKKYFFYYLLRKEFIKDCINASRGVAQLNLSTKWLEQYKIPVPPIAEQERIVAKIEELFSQSDKAIQTLQTVKQQLSIYRQSVLKSAFEGLENISTKSVCEHITDGDHMPPPKAKSGIPFIMISNIVGNTIDWSDTHYVNRQYYQNIGEARTPQKGDVLYTVTGSYGIPVLVNFEKEFCFQRHIALLRPITDKILSQYLYYALQAPDVYSQATKMATGTAQKTVGLGVLRKILIPYTPDLQKQQQIVSEIESRLSVCDSIEKAVDDALLQAEALRQSILKQAFEGELI